MSFTCRHSRSTSEYIKTAPLGMLFCALHGDSHPELSAATANTPKKQGLNSYPARLQGHDRHMEALCFERHWEARCRVDTFGVDSHIEQAEIQHTEQTRLRGVAMNVTKLNHLMLAEPHQHRSVWMSSVGERLVGPTRTAHRWHPSYVSMQRSSTAICKSNMLTTALSGTT